MYGYQDPELRASDLGREKSTGVKYYYNKTRSHIMEFHRASLEPSDVVSSMRGADAKSCAEHKQNIDPTGQGPEIEARQNESLVSRLLFSTCDLLVY